MAVAGQNPPADLASEILQTLSQKDPILSSEAFPDVQFVDLHAALDRLRNRSMIDYEKIDREEFILEPEGTQIAAHGSHEARVFDALRAAVNGLTIADLEKAIGDKAVAKLGQGKAFREKWISKGKDGKLVANVSTCSARPCLPSCWTNRYLCGQTT